MTFVTHLQSVSLLSREITFLLNDLTLSPWNYAVTLPGKGEENEPFKIKGRPGHCLGYCI